MSKSIEPAFKAFIGRENSRRKLQPLRLSNVTSEQNSLVKKLDDIANLSNDDDETLQQNNTEEDNGSCGRDQSEDRAFTYEMPELTQDKDDDRSDYILHGDKKDDYSKGLATPMRYVVTKEMLKHNVSLDHEKDRNIIINILKKKPEYKSKLELLFLQKALRNNAYFAQAEKELDETSFTSFFRELRPEKFSSGYRVFNFGEIAERFCIIIKGSVYVLQQIEEITDQEQKLADEKNHSHLPKVDLTVKTLSISDLSEEEKRKKVEMYYPGFKIVKTMGEGGAVGELGLQKGGKRIRTASIVCREDTLFGFLTYKHFQEILSQLYERKHIEKIQFFEKIDAFNHWYRDEIISLISQTEEVKFPKNKVVLRQGEISNNLYFVRSGEIELQQAVNLSQNEASEIFQTPEAREKLSKTQPIKPKKQDIVKLGKIVEGGYFGMSSSFEKNPSEWAAKVSSEEIVLLVISRDKFLRIVKGQQTLEKFQEHIARRDVWHKEMISNFISVNSRFNHRWWKEKGKQTPIIALDQSETKTPILKKIDSPHSSKSSKFSPVPKMVGNFTKVMSRNTSGEIIEVIAKPSDDRPKASSVGIPPIQSQIFSPKYMASMKITKNSKYFKHGSAYEKHKNKLIKYLEQKEENERVLSNEPSEAEITINTMPPIADDSVQENFRRDPVFSFIIKSPNTKSPFSSPKPLYINTGDSPVKRIFTEDDYKPRVHSSIPGLKFSTLQGSDSPKSPLSENLHKLLNNSFSDTNLKDMPSSRSFNFGDISNDGCNSFDGHSNLGRTGFVSRHSVKRNASLGPRKHLAQTLSLFSKKT